ncbi:hypothetical protein WJU16_02925 [Chitinophaga pollutisoli]|uniref:Uncharacterized protein n=1 Tax=Chitinophaga pollutisoli TaxID=3133966 RepID=A0ABZ2YR69_9BACT
MSYPTICDTGMLAGGMNRNYESDHLEITDIFSFVPVDENSEMNETLYNDMEAICEDRFIRYSPAHIVCYDEPQPRHLHDPAFTATLFALLNDISELINF